MKLAWTTLLRQTAAHCSCTPFERTFSPENLGCRENSPVSQRLAVDSERALEALALPKTGGGGAIKQACVASPRIPNKVSRAPATS